MVYQISYICNNPLLKQRNEEKFKGNQKNWKAIKKTKSNKISDKPISKWYMFWCYYCTCLYCKFCIKHISYQNLHGYPEE